MRNDLIEKLKDKKTAQAFGLRAPEEQACFRKVSKKNCVMFSDNCWSRAIGGGFVSGTTYAIKPDYQPEPKLNRHLYEELRSIKIASGTGNNKEPVWDGTVIGKPNQHTLEKMGLVECVHDYYFLTEKGKEAYKNYQPESEYLDLEVVRHAEGTVEQTWWLGVWADKRAELPHAFTHLHCLPSLPNFEGFWHDYDKKMGRRYFCNITEAAPKISEGKKVYARFRGQGQ